MFAFLVINRAVLSNGDISRAVIVAHDATAATNAFAELADEQRLPLSCTELGRVSDASQAMERVPSGFVLVFHQINIPAVDDNPEDHETPPAPPQAKEEKNDAAQTSQTETAPAGLNGGVQPRAHPGGGNVPRQSKQERRAARDQQRAQRSQAGSPGGNQTPPGGGH